MENLEKRQKLDWEVPTAFRDKLVCKKCDILPRPGTEVMRCVSCKNILCGKCCGTKCPLCRHESKNPRFSTFTKELELMEVLSGLKTHPCINVKNGCLEEISAKLDELKAHHQSCIFQTIPCPKMNCKKTIIFKDIDQHLKQGHSNDIEVYYGTETNVYQPYTHPSDIFGVYNDVSYNGLRNGRNLYAKDDYLYHIYWNKCGVWEIKNYNDKCLDGWLYNWRPRP